ncbi:uncharacterized protein LOC115547173 [Gadus morhua]|uniref:uncharacterized protein LOC115547173 n=1 Tax=Gadus morhua TaxID=8049 RepID=UPI0011B7A221|nr:uncharacterized protein LOC115547173 [Gadus morhua]
MQRARQHEERMSQQKRRGERKLLAFWTCLSHRTRCFFRPRGRPAFQRTSSSAGLLKGENSPAAGSQQGGGGSCLELQLSYLGKNPSSSTCMQSRSGPWALENCWLLTRTGVLPATCDLAWAWWGTHAHRRPASAGHLGGLPGGGGCRAAGGPDPGPPRPGPGLVAQCQQRLHRLHHRIIALGLVMVAVIVGSRKLGVNSDNLVTSIAASLGDLITLSLLAAISSFLFHHRDLWFLPPAVGHYFLLLIPLWVSVPRCSPPIREVLQSGLVGMALSSIGGLILDRTVSDPNFEGMAIFTPMIHGKPGSL